MYAIKIEIKLNNKERTKLAQHAGYSRFVYNYALGLYNQIDHKEYKFNTSKKIDTIKKLFTNYTKKEKEYQWCNKLSSRVYQNAFRALKNAFSRFFKGLGSYPRFKRKKNSCSFTVDSSNGKVLLPAGKSIKIPTLGTFRLKEALKHSYISQTFTVSKIADKWFVSFAVEAEKIPPLSHEITKPIGIDLGGKTFATLSDGSTIESPMPYRKAKTKLANFQYHNRHQQLGNRKQGIKTSNNARKSLKKLAKKHAKVANVRADFLQKTTTKLCQKYGHLRIENLNIKGMMANHKLAAAVGDLGAYEFKRQLLYKAEFFATKVDVIDQWYPSSKGCSNCGAIKTDLTLSDRIFRCNECGLTIDRDLNASVRLEKAPNEVVVDRVGYARINACGQ
ncbi:MAG: transposase [Gomphosphaeria aponina SAG 52.96 = DSM 107014]|uniref:Transposase n=1 Tax=Gomphosphaeria aponina SAG 52.96 = DSM 107014 TaxID=1521640 RepID=A0A941GRF5_9CHRO|nr:transposase [Gomphosphaeria aponina SAG 52.96 = DSM 107014]